MKNTIYGLQIDMLRLCFEVEDPDLFDHLAKINVGEIHEFYEFYLLRVDGKRFEYVFEIRYEELGENKLFGELRFGINHDDEEANTHISGKRKVWMSISNRVLYTEDEFHYLGFICETLCLELHNITCLDLSLDMSMNIAKYLKKLIRCRDLGVILNGKRIYDRREDRPEIIYTITGNLNRYKYLTVNIKERKAIKDKSRGRTLIAYNKLAEIKNSSGKEYIPELYGNPKRLHRIEIHLNNEELKEYFNKSRKELNWGFIFNEKELFELFYSTLERLIRFELNGKKIEWWDILERNVAGV